MNIQNLEEVIELFFENGKLKREFEQDYKKILMVQAEIMILKNKARSGIEPETLIVV